jgi:tRNA-Thr(GGU) m(6)t(6)A37 methyltransferase TsaA
MFMTEGRPATETYRLVPIGRVRQGDEGCYLEILEPYRPALKQLDQFSHVMTFWWADQSDNDTSRSMMQCRPPYAADYVTGVFATRAEYRPNPIALTTSRILSVDEGEGIVRLAYMDAVDGTPVIDLKAYFPVCDRVKDVHIPEWLSGWPAWLPEEEGFDVEEC